MKLTRRSMLSSVTGLVPVAALAAVASEPAQAEVAVRAASITALGLLYDATKCIGCKSCEVACVEANGDQPDTRRDGMHLAAEDLNDRTRTVIKLYKPVQGKSSFIKRQCMHCFDPSCVAGCPFQALHKEAETGLVAWDSAKCIGCRYCTIACPYGIPRFQWVGVNPRVAKCELCRTRLAAGKQPGCTSVCPTGAVKFGRRDALLREAKQRIRENPGRYYRDYVYGEHEGGGTQVLYLAGVPFTDLGLPKMAEESVPAKYLKWQERVYEYMIAPAFLYVGLVEIIRRRFRPHAEELREEEHKTGLRAQI